MKDVKHPLSEKKLHSFIEDTFLCEYGSDFSDDTDLFKAGIIDSFGYIQLIKFLEKELNLSFSREDMLSNVLVSLAEIKKFSLQQQEIHT